MKRLEQQRGFLDLVDGIRDYQAENFDKAQSNWGAWTRQQDDILGCFARSLQANLSSDVEGVSNLYSPDQAPAARQIDLFREISRLPHIDWPRRLTAKLHRTHRQPKTTHLELGIGSGEQAQQIVEASEGQISRVVGVDFDPASVEMSRERFARMSVDFVGIVEPFDHLDWTQLRSIAGDALTVNAAFALHHLSLPEKRRVLQGVASLSPRLLTLIEPSSDHWSADLLTRFVNAYSHFQVVGELIGTLETSVEIRRGLLQFFGREIDDIMRDSPARFERHEQWTFWYGELLRCGMAPLGLESTVADTPMETFQPEVSGPGVATICKRTTPLVSVFAFGKPGPKLVYEPEALKAEPGGS